jgi:hypothetical protein
MRLHLLILVVFIETTADETCTSFVCSEFEYLDRLDDVNIAKEDYNTI